MERLLVLYLYLLSIVWIVMGALLVFATDLARKKVCNKLMAKANLKKMGPLPIILGVLLLLASTYNRYTLLVMLLGLLGVIKGIVMIVATEKMEKVVDWWLKASDNFYRAWGIVIIIIGSVVLMGI